MAEQKAASYFYDWAILYGSFISFEAARLPDQARAGVLSSLLFQLKSPLLIGPVTWNDHSSILNIQQRSRSQRQHGRKFSSNDGDGPNVQDLGAAILCSSPPRP